MALELTGMQRVRERPHLAPLRVDERHYVLAPRVDRLLSGSSQSDVKRRSVLGVVDRMPGEHQLDPSRHLGLLGELDQQVEPMPVEELTAEVEQQALPLQGEVREAARL